MLAFHIILKKQYKIKKEVILHCPLEGFFITKTEHNKTLNKNPDSNFIGKTELENITEETHKFSV